MARFIIYMLLFIVIFLSGMIVGINQHTEQEEQFIVEEDLLEDIEVDSTLYSYEDSNNKMFTQKFASFFEKIISGVYNIIVSIMYNIAKLFTG